MVQRKKGDGGRRNGSGMKAMILGRGDFKVKYATY
jgi:hypothetical protein